MGSMRQTLMINIIRLIIYERETKVGSVLHCGLNFQECQKILKMLWQVVFNLDISGTPT